MKLSLGFTFIELITVIGLIGVIALFTGKVFVSKAHEKNAEYIMGDILTVATSAQNYFMTHGQWPDANNNCGNLFDVLDGTYFDAIETNIDSDETEDFGWECPLAGSTNQRPLLVLTWEMPNKPIQEILDSVIPLSVSLEDKTNEELGLTIYRLSVSVPAPSVTSHSTTNVLRRYRIDSVQGTFNSECEDLGMDTEILTVNANAFCAPTILGIQTDLKGHRVRKTGTSTYTVQIQLVGDDLGWINSQSTCGSVNVGTDILYKCEVEGSGG